LLFAICYCQELNTETIIQIPGLIENSRASNASFKVVSVLNISSVLFCAQCKCYMSVTLLGWARSRRHFCGCREIGALLARAQN